MSQLLSRTQVREHTGSYQTISTNSPTGLQCLKALFEEEDSIFPSKGKLSVILAKDFRDLENGKERSKGRKEVIELIMSRKSRYCKYQTEIMQAWCITNSNKTQTVLFEGIRFIILQNDTEWVRIPLSGRLEVRPVTVNGRATGEVVLRKLTLDLSSFWKRKQERASTSLPPSPGPIGHPSPGAARQSPLYELPAPPASPSPTRAPDHLPDRAQEEYPYWQNQSTLETPGRGPRYGGERNAGVQINARNCTFVPHSREETFMESSPV